MPVLLVHRFDHRRFDASKLQKLNVFDTAHFFMDVYCLEPGQSQKPHKHAESEKVYAVLEGQIEVQVGEDTARLGPGEAALAPAGFEHGIENTGQERAAVLVFMTPKP